MLMDRRHYKALLHRAGFGPISQDLWALQLIRERGASPLIDAGQFELAVAKVGDLWTSLPSAGNGQPEHGIGKLGVAYLNAGGVVACSYGRPTTSSGALLLYAANQENPCSSICTSAKEKPEIT